MIPEITLESHLRDGGLLQPFTDGNGALQPQPSLQMYEFDESALDNSDRCLLIRNAGAGSGTYGELSPQYTFVVFSKARAGDLGATRDYIEMIKSWILSSYERDDIIGISALGDVSGPYQLDSGRRAFEFNVTLTIDTGVIN